MSSKLKSKPGSIASSLARAAAAIPMLAPIFTAQAQSAADSTTVSIKYAHYEEYQGSGVGRMKVNAPMAWIKTPLSSKTELETSFVWDSMSGASASYLSTLTGASIQDNRYAGDAKITQYWDQFSLGLGGVYSDEDDYISRAGALDARWWTEDKNTVFAASAGLSNDSVFSSISPQFSEGRNTSDYLLGVTQILDRKSLMQSNVTFTNADGYLSDPYKALDNRPSSRDSIAWLTRYIRYVEEADASIHVDYRLYADSWQLSSNMVEVAWYQPVRKVWMIRPSVRYYTQNGADFFSNTYPPAEFGQFYTTDQRLADYGSIGIGLKIARDLSNGYSADVMYQYEYQSDDLKLGGASTTIEPFSLWTIMVGFTKKF